MGGSQLGHVLTSLIVGLGTALLAVAVAVPAAYALSKYRLRVTLVIVSSLLVAQIIPSIVLATSLFIVFHWIHLVNSYPGLISPTVRTPSPLRSSCYGRSSSACPTS